MFFTLYTGTLGKFCFNQASTCDQFSGSNIFDVFSTATRRASLFLPVDLGLFLGLTSLSIGLPAISSALVSISPSSPITWSSRSTTSSSLASERSIICGRRLLYKLVLIMLVASSTLSPLLFCSFSISSPTVPPSRILIASR